MPELEQAPQLTHNAEIRGSELRQHRRFVCVDGSVLRLAVCPEFRGRRALLVDVSAGGIGFLMEDPLEAGTVLTFEMCGTGDVQAAGRIARVRHSRPHAVPAGAPWLPPTPVFSKLFRGIFGAAAKPAASSAWLVGCAFDRPLTDLEVQQLLDQLQSQPDAEV